IAASGVAAGQAARATANVLSDQPAGQGLGQPQDMAVDAIASLTGAAVGKAMSGSVPLNKLSPNDVVEVGFATFFQGTVRKELADSKVTNRFIDNLRSQPVIYKPVSEWTSGVYGTTWSELWGDIIGESDEWGYQCYNLQLTDSSTDDADDDTDKELPYEDQTQ
ncbi:MAG: hypothetical protein V1921_01555, partial [Candidatus Altiarchaeota archaeon]